MLKLVNFYQAQGSLSTLLSSVENLRGVHEIVSIWLSIVKGQIPVQIEFKSGWCTANTSTWIHVSAENRKYKSLMSSNYQIYFSNYYFNFLTYQGFIQ